jgi:hypothetical protein
LGEPIFKIIDQKNKIYHAEWSPNGKWLTVSRGPKGKGDLSKLGTHMAAREVVGVYATGWNLFTVKVKKGANLDLNADSSGACVQITTDGRSYKEPEWIPVKK